MSHQVLYRFYDQEGSLLYVGISNTWYQRFHNHERKAGWFSKVASSTFEWHESRESVEAAELLAIKTENPQFNKASNPAYETPTDHFQKIKLWTHSDLDPDERHAMLISHMKEYLSARPEIKGKQSKWIALAFIDMYYEIGPSGFIDCRNCDAMGNSENINRWSDDAYESLRGIHATN
jgi:predicted GIY-YIG superfamily endonuclease